MARIGDPMRQWKLSPMDICPTGAGMIIRGLGTLCSRRRSRYAPWHIVRSDDKRRARLNCIAHLLKNDSLQEGRLRSTECGCRNDPTRAATTTCTSLRAANFVTERY